MEPMLAWFPWTPLFLDLESCVGCFQLIFDDDRAEAFPRV
jgi:hypothetical protein